MFNLLVRGSDRDGATDGLSSECDCRIKILDVNDNFPILEKTSVSHYFNDLFPLTVVCLHVYSEVWLLQCRETQLYYTNLLLYGNIPTCLSFSFYLLIFLCVYVSVCYVSAHRCHGTHVKVRGQLSRVFSLFYHIDAKVQTQIVLAASGSTH